MKNNFKLFLGVLLFITLIQQCTFIKNSVQSATVVRQNYFDSTYYKMAHVDTNMFSKYILEKVFERIQFVENASCLLVETMSNQVPIRQYELYDFNTRKYYVASNEEKNFSFKEVTDSTADEIDLIKSLQDKSQAQLVQAASNRPYPNMIRNDFNSHVANLISVTDAIIQIKAYYFDRFPFE